MRMAVERATALCALTSPLVLAYDELPAEVAQLVEHSTENAGVPSSTLGLGTSGALGRHRFEGQLSNGNRRHYCHSRRHDNHPLRRRPSSPTLLKHSQRSDSGVGLAHRREARTQGRNETE